MGIGGCTDLRTFVHIISSMQPVFTPSILESNLTCPECNWKGKGSETSQENFRFEDSIELYCPSCNHYFGLVNTSKDTETGV